jgi:hypothetical protein
MVLVADLHETLGPGTGAVLLHRDEAPTLPEGEQDVGPVARERDDP